MIDLTLLKKAQRAAEHAQGLTEDLNLELQRVELALANLRLGVSASVALYPESPGRLLKFGKGGDKWRLIVIDGDGPDANRTVLLNCARETRLHVPSRLPDLLEALIEAAEQESDRLLESCTKARAFLDNVKNL
jgi:hypothetical protein